MVVTPCPATFILEHPLPRLLVKHVVTVEAGGPLEVPVAELEGVDAVDEGVVFAAGDAQEATLLPSASAAVEQTRGEQQPL